MKEIWKDVPDWEGLYQVSNTGKVRSLDRRSGTRQIKGVELKGSLAGGRTGSGYRMITLCGNGKRSYRYIHHLVAEAFIGPRPDGLDINHKDGDKENNCAANLEYATRSENMIHARDVIGIDYALGSQVGASKLTESEVIEMRRLYAAGGTSHRKLAKVFGVHYSTVARIVEGNSWSWLK